MPVAPRRNSDPNWIDDPTGECLVSGGTMLLSTAQRVPVSAATALLVAGGTAVVAGLVSAATTQQDGTRNVRKKYDGEYQLRPTSKDAANASIDTQRLLSGGAAIVGGGILGVQLLGASGLHGAILGGMLLGGGVGRLVKLAGAKDRIDASLPEHTPAGQPDMTRHNKHLYQQEGAGYNAYGISQAPRWGQSSFSPTYQQHALDKMMPTLPNALHMGTYLGGNVTPGGPFGLATPTGIADANANGVAAATQFAAEQQVLEQFRQQ